jgi:hypothetical protein
LTIGSSGPPPTFDAAAPSVGGGSTQPPSAATVSTITCHTFIPVPPSVICMIGLLLVVRCPARRRVGDAATNR